MKDATGELSMTAIAVVAIAAIAVIFTTLILPRIRGTIQKQSMCATAFNCKCSGATCKCNYYDDNGVAVTNGTIDCPAQKTN